MLKDDAGNGMIGVSGHSMGGYSSEYAVIFDEIDAATNGYRKIAAALPVGADFRYIYGFDDPYSFFGPRSAGVIAAHWDQFFYDNSADPVGSVIYKDYTEDEVGLKFLGRDDEGTAKAGVYYTMDGGQRVIYTPDETHPQQTWSLKTGADTIEFFEEAFEYQFNLYDLGDLEDHGITTGKTGQTWWLKEGFTLIGLLALVGMMFAGFALLIKLPVFNMTKKDEETDAVTEETDVEPQTTGSAKGLKFLIIMVATLLGAYFLPYFMDRMELTPLADFMYYVIGAAGFVTLAVWIMAIVKDNGMVKKARRVTTGALLIVFVALAYRWLLTHTDIITDVVYWSAPSVNTIVYWAMSAGLLLLLIVFTTTPMFTAGEGNDENTYGLKASAGQIIAGFLVALVLAFSLILLVGIVEWVFLTDFRFYTYAIKIFNSQQFGAALKYMPLLFIYFFAAGVAIFVNTRKIKGWLGDLLAAFLLAAPVVLFLIYQYFTLYKTGVAAFPGFSLSGILAMGLVPTLVIAGIILRRFAMKTGHIWAGVFFTTVFFTLITLANTCVYQLTLG